jgi:hypothetical protein
MLLVLQYSLGLLRCLMIGLIICWRTAFLALRLQPGHGWLSVNPPHTHTRTPYAQASTGCSDERMFEALYQHYAQPGAWEVAPGAEVALASLRSGCRGEGGGCRLAVVSNFDTRLRPLLGSLELSRYFDAIIVSAGAWDVFIFEHGWCEYDCHRSSGR